METTMNIGVLSAELFKQTESYQLMFSSTTGDYWAFGLPTNLTNIDNLRQVNNLNTGS